ncbi:MAG: hypothetical protein ACYTEQ_30255 [Planctomycetota bacterium]|jgi:hypothetical protein
MNALTYNAFFLRASRAEVSITLKDKKAAERLRFRFYAHRTAMRKVESAETVAMLNSVEFLVRDAVLIARPHSTELDIALAAMNLTGEEEELVGPKQDAKDASKFPQLPADFPLPDDESG